MLSVGSLCAGIDGAGIHQPGIRGDLGLCKTLDVSRRIKNVGLIVVAHVKRTVAADSHGTIGH